MNRGTRVYEREKKRREVTSRGDWGVCRERGRKEFFLK